MRPTARPIFFLLLLLVGLVGPAFVGEGSRDFTELDVESAFVGVTVVVSEDDGVEVTFFVTDPEVFLDGVMEPEVGLMVALDELMVGLTVAFELMVGLIVEFELMVGLLVVFELIVGLMVGDMVAF